MYPGVPAALFTTARTRKQCRFPLTDEWIISRLIKAPNRISKKRDLSLQDCKQKDLIFAYNKSCKQGRKRVSPKKSIQKK